MAIARVLEQLLRVATLHEGAYYARRLHENIDKVSMTHPFLVASVDGDAPWWVKDYLNKGLQIEGERVLTTLNEMTSGLDERHDVVIETEDGLAFVFQNVPTDFDAEMAVEALYLFANELQVIRSERGDAAALEYYKSGWQPHVDRIIADFVRTSNRRWKKLLNPSGAEIIPFKPRVPQGWRNEHGVRIPTLPGPKRPA